MSNKSSVSGKYLSRIFRAQGDGIQDDKAARYDSMILSKQRKALERKRKQERQNKRKARRK
jgi:hypothetical protein